MNVMDRGREKRKEPEKKSKKNHKRSPMTSSSLLAEAEGWADRVVGPSGSSARTFLGCVLVARNVNTRERGKAPSALALVALNHTLLRALENGEAGVSLPEVVLALSSLPVRALAVLLRGVPLPGGAEELLVAAAGWLARAGRFEDCGRLSGQLGLSERLPAGLLSEVVVGLTVAKKAPLVEVMVEGPDPPRTRSPRAAADAVRATFSHTNEKHAVKLLQKWRELLDEAEFPEVVLSRAKSVARGHIFHEQWSLLDRHLDACDGSPALLGVREYSSEQLAEAGFTEHAQRVLAGEPLPESAGEDLHHADPRYLNLPDDVGVVIVDDEASAALAHEALGAAVMVGLDAEWRPAALSSAEHREPLIQVLQVATERSVFLFDMTSPSAPSFDGILSALFSDPAKLKIGFGLREDMRRIKSYSPALQACNVANLMDLMSLPIAATLPDAPERSEEAGKKTGKSHRGLSGLCARVLGKPLNKAKQCSDWGARPLTQAMIHYAALDAMCLVMIFKTLHPKGEPEQPLQQQQQQQQLEIDATRPRAPAQATFVADQNCSSLARKMRGVGLDVEIASSGVRTEAPLMAASFKPKRTVLTRRAEVVEIADSMDLASILLPPRPPKDLRAEMIEFIVKPLGLRLTKSDLLSRCVVCNGDDWAQISAEAAVKVLGPTAFRKSGGVPDSEYEFWQCNRCQKVYWTGSGFQKAMGSFADMIDGI